MIPNRLHIVSFDIPFPPSYGGAIDVYYKLKDLSAAGIRITLHCFYKGDFRNPPELDALCRDVFYYPRKMNWRKAAGTAPFIIASRTNAELIERLAGDDAPILLEGMHTAAVLRAGRLKDRRILLRMHNVEWTYYEGLAANETAFWKRLYYRMEARRLERSAAVIGKADEILAISEPEQREISAHFRQCRYLPPFHGNNGVSSTAGKGRFALYHGNLGVSENRRVAEFLVGDVFGELDFPLKIAGSNAPEAWKARIMDRMAGSMEFISRPSDEQLHTLIRDAHIHVLPAVQPTGVKLKLLYALFCGRHCIVNPAMVQDSSLARLCHIAMDAEGFREKVNLLVPLEFTEQEIAIRKELLEDEFSDRKNADRLIRWIFPGR